MKRWRLEDHYTPIYEAMVKRDMVAPGSYAPEPGTNGPHPLYALVIDFLAPPRPRWLRRALTTVVVLWWWPSRVSPSRSCTI
jgi:hypothetical protein